MNDREQILSRIRSALGDVDREEATAWRAESDSDPAVAYQRSGSSDVEALAALFAERCGDYQASVVRCGADNASVVAAVAAAASRHRARQLVSAPGWPSAWTGGEISLQTDSPALSLSELDAADGVVSLCALAIASTGTIVLDAGAGQGRRVLTLVPDLHICVVRAEQIVYGVPEAIIGLHEAVADGKRPLTMISGPSATSDIELSRVEGVHGPRRLEVIVIGRGEGSRA